MPWLFLWLSAYNLGWVYFLNHYFVLDYLDLYVLSHVDYPIVSWIMVSLVFTYLISGLFVIGKLNRIAIICVLCLVGIYIIALINLSRDHPYTTIYWRNTTYIYSAMFIASVSIASIVHKKRQYPRNNIELAHMLWYLTYALFFGTANGLMSINGMLGLNGYIDTPENTLQIIAYFCSMLSMLAMGVMVQPDDILYRTIYPIRLWQLHRLQRLRNAIHLKVKTKTEMSKVITTGNLDTRIHDAVVTILDYYPYLDDDNALRNCPSDIEASAINLEDIVQKMIRINTKVN